MEIFLQSAAIDDLIKILVKSKSIWGILLSGSLLIILLVYFRKHNIEKGDIELNMSGKSNIEPISDNDILSKCTNLLKEGNTELAIKILVNQLELKAKDNDEMESLYRDTLLISNRYRRLNRQNIQNTISQHEMNIEFNRINSSLLSTLSTFNILVNKWK